MIPMAHGESDGEGRISCGRVVRYLDSGFCQGARGGGRGRGGCVGGSGEIHESVGPGTGSPGTRPAVYRCWGARRSRRWGWMVPQQQVTVVPGHQMVFQTQLPETGDGDVYPVCGGFGENLLPRPSQRYEALYIKSLAGVVHRLPGQGRQNPAQRTPPAEVELGSVG